MRYSIFFLCSFLIAGCDSKQSAGKPDVELTSAEIVDSSRTKTPSEDEIKVILEALSRDDLEAVKEGFGDDIDPDFTFADGKTVLSASASLGNLDATKFMLEIGANPNKGDYRGMTPLHYAALYGRGDSVIPVLIDVGVSVNVREASGLTPLHCAATGDSEATVKLLLASGADKNLKDGFGSTPAKTAELNNKAELARVIKDYTK